MRHLIVLFLKICFLEESPKNVPFSLTLCIGLLLLNILLNTGVFLQGVTFSDALLVSSLSALIKIMFVYLILYMRHKTNRFIQLISCIFGVEFILKGFGFLILNILGISAFSFILLLIWQLAIFRHIFAEGFDLRPWFALGLAVVFDLAHALILKTLFESIFSQLQMALPGG